MRKRIGYFLRLLRQFWLRQKGMYIGRGCEIRKKVFFDNASRVSIGHYSFVNRGCEFHTGAGKTNRIVLGNNVYVGMNVCFICVSHELGSPKKRAGVNKYGDIIVEDEAWIGANVTILPGVRIGTGAVVAAGAVVCKSVRNNELIGGTPAKPIKYL